MIDNQQSASAIPVALIGYGYWGPNLARNLHASPHWRLVACCDSDPARLRAAQQLYPALGATSDLALLLADETIKALVIATPARSHSRLASQALAAGKHVLVEKPLALSMADAWRLIEQAEAAGCILMVGHTFQYNPAVHKIQSLVQSNEIGDLYYLYSTRVNLGRVQRDLNALWSIAPHDVSIMLLLLGQMPVEVSARGGAYLNGALQDVVFLDLRFPNGVLGHIHASWLDPVKTRRMTVVGSRKMIVYDDLEGEGKIKVYDKGAYRVSQERPYGEFQYRLHSGDIYIPRIDMSEPLRNEVDHFAHCIRRHDRPASDGHAGLRVVQVLEAAQRSLDRGGVPVALESLPKAPAA